MRLKTLDHLLRTGTLCLHAPGGGIRELGHGPPRANIHLRSRLALPRILLDPGLNFGETYMDGQWEAGAGGLLRIFEVLARNHLTDGPQGPWRWLRRLPEINTGWLSRRHVRRHYDLDESLYRRFLDADMQYSCAYFARPDMSLEQAQQAKCRHIGRKLRLSGGEHVLDIGSGWGGLGLFLAREYGASVTGLTLSRHQLETARRRAREAGLEGRLRFVEQDYRAHRGCYDAIVSVGMFEHVGRPQYRTFFSKLAELLKPGGRVLLHTIGRNSPPATTNPWIQRRIFPGGYIPALSELMAGVEPSALIAADCEIWRLHYADTLRHWHARFQQARHEFRARLGERFCRMWEFYLQASEAMFRWGDLVVFQLQLAADHAALPITRDYQYPVEAAGRQAAA